MTLNFCTQTAGKIRRLGYAPERAAWFAGFFFCSMLSFCAATGVLTFPSEGVHGWINGSGESPEGARSGSITPGFF
jgi:hypothetical protein